MGPVRISAEVFWQVSHGFLKPLQYAGSGEFRLFPNPYIITSNLIRRYINCVVEWVSLNNFIVNKRIVSHFIVKIHLTLY
jgi:hypothetical protein